MATDPARPDGAVRVTWVGHATVLVELAGTRLLTDPLVRPRLAHLRRVVPAVNPGALTGIDAVLISHVHLDHLDVRSLRRVGRPRLIVPRGAAGLLRRAGFDRVAEIAIGETVEVGRVTVRAVPAHHDGRRWPLGPGADTLGYVIEGGARIYFAGDTDLYAGMAELAPGLDVALLPVWGWGPSLGPGHMGPREAAEALALLRPRVAIPIHWGTLSPRRPMKRHPNPARPPREFAELVARQSPGVEVRVLQPGARTVIS